MTQSYEGNGFVVNPAAGLDGGSTVLPAGNIMILPSLQADQQQAQGTGTRIDKVPGMDTAGYAANGAAYLTLTSTTAITIDLTALAATTGVVVAGTSTFATWFKIILYNTGAVDLIVAAGASNGLRLPINGTAPTYTVPAGSHLVLESVAGFTVDGTHKTLTVTPTAGGSIGICVGGA